MLAAGCSSGTTDTTTPADEAVTTTTTSTVTTTAASAITIMHMGEGLTQGEVGVSTYRCFLDMMLHDAGVAFDFAGSRNEPQDGDVDDYGCPTDFDQDHEAWFRAVAGSMETQKMAESAEALQPDVALIYLGGTDVWHQEDPVGASERLALFITGLQAANPDITLLVASLIPCRTPLPWCVEGYPAFNDAIASFGSLSTDESRVLFVDMTTGISTDLLRSNNLSFTDEGDEMMAGRWMAALEELGVISTNG
jgi:hypothetical protein